MKKSALQVARAAYQPKLPKSLKGTVHIKEGAVSYTHLTLPTTERV